MALVRARCGFSAENRVRQMDRLAEWWYTPFNLDLCRLWLEGGSRPVVFGSGALEEE
jgi:hypothetical protein